jgi:hypothetical protein
MITLEVIKAWAAGIAQSQGTATPEEEAIAHRIRTEDARLRPLATWACFREAGSPTLPWMAVINGPDGCSYHVDRASFIELAAAISSAAADRARFEHFEASLAASHAAGS